MYTARILIVVIVIAGVFLVISTMGSCIQRSQVLETERWRMIQDEKTTRTRERWDAAQRLPFLKKDSRPARE